MSGVAPLIEHMDFQITEVSTECDVLLGRYVLIPKQQYQVLFVGLPKSGHVPVTRWPGQVNAMDLGPQRAIEWFDRDSH